MTCLFRSKLTKRRPNNWIDRSYKIMVPFAFTWRVTIGKTTCTCTQVHEHYQPWYGFTWYHSDDCALIRAVKERPGLLNLPAFENVEIIAHSD